MLDAAAGQAGSAGQLQGQPGVQLQRIILDRPAPSWGLYWHVLDDGADKEGRTV